MKKIIALTLVLCMILSMVPMTLAAEEPMNAIDYFQSPDYTAKPMARMWFPDATAGMDPNDTIEEQILALAEAGFGGVEVAMLSDSAEYTNEQAKYCGWGTEAWVKLLKKIYTAANQVEDGFVVDLTITAHWPPCLNTLDPNDEAASQEITSSVTKLTEEALKAGSMKVNLPETKTADGNGLHFIFTDRIINAVVAKVDSIATKTSGGGGGWGPPPGGGPGGPAPFSADANEYEVPVLDYSTLQVVPVSVIEGDTTKAGVPDAATCEAYGWDYEKDIVANYGPEPGEIIGDTKQDAEFNRARMADTQYNYEVDLAGLEGVAAASEGDEVQAGDWVIVSTFNRGTGQGRSGGSMFLMYNRTYVMNYFDDSGVQAIADYWAENILCDEELAAMIRANGGAIFEDSIETSVSTSLWTDDLMEELAAFYGDDYAYAGILPTIMGGFRGATGFGATAGTDTYDFTNVEVDGINMEDRIIQDYNSLMGHLYNTQHLEPANEWAESIGCAYRGQTYDLSGMDIAGAASVATIPEGDNMTKGDGLRQLSAAVNLYDKKFLSMEAITGWSQYQFNWETVLYELTANFSWGVNRAIFHGTAYSKAINGKNADWPGWDQFGGSFGEAYTYRQIYFHDMPMVTNYVARNQALFQYTNQSIDVAVVRDAAESFENPSGNSMQKLLDNGYSYNIMSEALLKGENAQKISNGMIYEDGPGYRAVVLNEVKSMSCDALDVLLKYAEAGIPVIAVDSNPTTVYGSDKGDNTDANVVAKYAQLLAYDCVVSVETVDEVPTALKAFGVAPHAQYELPSLETTRYTDHTDGTSYYYMFNNNSTFAGMISGTGGKSYKDGTYGYDIIDAIVTLEGDGVPYILDAMTGEVYEVPQYTVNEDGTVTVLIDKIKAGNAVIVALSENTEDFPAPTVHVEVAENGADYQVIREADGSLSLRSAVAGTYKLTNSYGETVKAKIDETKEVVNLAELDWNLVIDSYGPTYENASELVDELGIQTVDPSDTTIITHDFGSVELVDWKNLTASQEVLDKLGVESMSHVSGKGYYTATFDWDGSDASLWIAYGNDQYTGLNINGYDVPVLDNMTDVVDLGGYLVEGQNTIVVEISTTLADRAYVENDAFRSPSTTVNGLLEATLTPYTDVALTKARPTAQAALNGADTALVSDELTYTVSLAEAENVGTVTAYVELSEAPADVEGLNGWSILSDAYENGVLTVVAYYPLDGDDFTEPQDILAITMAPTGEPVQAAATLTGIDLSAFTETGETFMTTTITNATVETAVDYSRYDVNRDGVVNQLDITRAQRFYGTNDPICDIDGNGVGVSDLIAILNNYTA